MERLVERAYAGADDLRRMEELLARGYTSTSLRVGDLCWLSRDHTHRELSLDIRLWEDPSALLQAWAYVRSNGEFNVFVAPDSAYAEDAAFFATLLDFVERAQRSAVAARDQPVTLVTYGIDPGRSALDRSLAAALDRRGYQRDDSGNSGVLAGLLDSLPQARLADGFHFDWIRTPGQMTGRVEAHRAAFAPSDLSAKRYERVQRTWAYRAELDRLVVTDDGEVVAFCTAWFDAHNASGLLEPVGTHPGAPAARTRPRSVSDACRALRGLGARRAQVGFESEAGFATYSSLGFELAGHEICFSLAPGKQEESGRSS